MNKGNVDLNVPASGEMHRLSKPLVKGAAAGAVLVGLGLATLVFAGSAPLPGNSHAFGKTLAQWEDLYMRWFVGSLAIPADGNGNAVVGNVVLMPLPNASGDGTPAHLDVTLNSGQAFVLPLVNLLGTSYTDGTPPDPFVNLSFFTTMALTLQIDGVTVIDSSNQMDYYSQFPFVPPIPINSPPIDSVIWCQAFGFVHTPLSVGTHTIKLDEKSAEHLPPGFGGGLLEFHNTWTVKVRPGH